MTTRPIALIPAACVSLLLMLAPGAAVSQDQKVPSGQQPEKNAVQPVQTPTDSASAPSGTAEGAQQPQPASQKKTEPAVPANEESAEYVIKQGDTLWDISNTYLKDPFLWPFIWKANPAISNPDLIYAGNKLIIPGLAPIERAMQATSAEEAPQAQVVEKPVPTEEENKPTPETGSLAGLGATHAMQQPEAGPSGGGNRLIMPEEQPKPIIDKYAMLSAGFVNSVESSGIIVGAPGNSKTIYAFGDSVYVKFASPGDVNVGDKFLIYSSEGNVIHPLTGKRYGRLVRGLGVLQITAKDPAAVVITARITLSFDSIEINNFVTPYEEPVLLYPSSDKRTKDISGCILEVTDRRTIVGQMDFVYLDKGSADGVDPGDSFAVYTGPANRGEPRKKIGEVQVFLVKDHSSTAIIRRSTEAMERGNTVNFNK
jgi:LysM repeat protein